MKCRIAHEIQGRIRFAAESGSFDVHEADAVYYSLMKVPDVTDVKVYERTGSMAVAYRGDRNALLQAVKDLDPHSEEARGLVPENTGRELNQYYKEKIIACVVRKGVERMFLPCPVRTVLAILRSWRYVLAGLRCLLKGQIKVAVLDGTAILVSILRRDFDTASSVMFMLSLGDLMEEWTHKKSVDDLARSMSLKVDKVWLKRGEEEVLVPFESVENGDEILVRVSETIPVDGVVVSGEAMVNQASLTGEAVPVAKKEGRQVYAGTVIEEGELVLKVQGSKGNTRYERIVHMIEESEKLKSAVEAKAEHMADKLVPYTFAGTFLTYLLTRNVTKALSVLMVDYSCALKLAMPVSVLSAMRECSDHGIVVKGGKFLEAVAEADTIVFDKTGTMTKAQPTVIDVVSTCEENADEMLRLAACLEEHFPHSIANAVVAKAVEKGLRHDELHSKVEYVVAHGIATSVGDERILIGSAHFIFEDEKIHIPEEYRVMLEHLPEEYSYLYLAKGGELAAVITIADPLREEAADVVRQLKECGIRKVVMMTGDSEKTARAIAAKTGVDQYYAEVLPEDKAGFVEKEKKAGHKVIMVGDGINDSPALSAADTGIAMSEGAQIAREIADVMISGEDLYSLVRLRKLSAGLMKRIHGNYRAIVGINSGILGLGVTGVITPNTAAILHNTSTIGIGLKSLTNLLEESLEETFRQT